MELTYTYIIKLSIALAVVYLFYALFLRRLTFYNWNRWYLVGYTFLAFVMPFVDITPVLQQHRLEGQEMVNYIPVMDYRNLIQRSEPAGWTLQQGMLLLIAAGMLVMLGRLLFQHVSLYRLRSKAQLLIDDSVKLYQVDAPIMPFSYGNAIYVNPAQHNEDELREIIRHEFVHVKQQHTLDMLWSELLCIVNWYNPFAWLIRKAIRQNLEYIADRQVLRHGMDKKAYQYLLLKVIGVKQYSFATPFNFTSLKNRIAMMNKMRSAQTQLLKFAFLLPLLVVLLLAFRNANGGEKIKDLFTADGSPALDTVPRPAKPLMPEGVKKIWITHDVVTVTRKDGKVEKYDLNNETEMAEYKKKYGALPVPPPPPPPPAAPLSPKAPKEVAEVPGVPLPPAAPALPDAEDWARSTPPQTPNNKGYILSVADNNGECIVIIKNKAGKIERSMLLTDWTANEKANVAKYGSIPPPPAKADRYGVNSAAKAPELVGDATIIQAPVSYSATLKVDPVNISGDRRDAVQPVTSAIRYNGKENPLIIIDGVKQPTKEVSASLNALDPSQIGEIQVLKGESATAIYGEEGKDGVVLITTKGKTPPPAQQGVTMSIKKNEDPARKPGVTVTGKGMQDFQGIYVIDGKTYTSKEFAALNIEPTAIASISILKGDTAEKKYGEKGKMGVVEISLK